MSHSTVINVGLNQPMFQMSEGQESLSNRLHAQIDLDQVQFGGSFESHFGGITSLCREQSVDGPLEAAAYALSDDGAIENVQGLVVSAGRWDPHKFRLLVQFCRLANIRVFDLDLDPPEQGLPSQPLQDASIVGRSVDMRLFSRCPDCHEPL